MEPFPDSSIKELAELDSSSYLSDCVRHVLAPWLRHFFQSPLQGMCFCLVLFLHHDRMCLFFSITKVPKDFSHFAVVLVVNNPMQRDEHTKGQYTNAMHMHVHAFHTHTHSMHT